MVLRAFFRLERHKLMCQISIFWLSILFEQSSWNDFRISWACPAIHSGCCRCAVIYDKDLEVTQNPDWCTRSAYWPKTNVVIRQTPTIGDELNGVFWEG